jgi:hypothetical protein
MPTLAGDLVARVAGDSDRADLGGFRCGPHTIYPEAEREVDSLVALWVARAPERKDMLLRITREEPPGSVMGVAGLERGDMTFQNPKFSAPYRDADDPYRTKTDVRMGDFLLHDTLLHIKKNWRGGMPWVFTAVHPDNEPSVSLFKRHGFEFMFRLPPKGDAIYRRPKNLKVP